MVSNRRTADTSGADFYPTPIWGTKALLKYETFSGNILEPCCGEGDMAEVLKETGCQIHAYDLHDRGYGIQKDFFDIFDQYENVITNPPYNIAPEILEHALKISTSKVCLLVRTAFLESRSRYMRFYRDNPPARVLIFSERLSMYPKGYDAKSGGTTSYSWLIWDKQDTTGITQLKWIAPGLKNSQKI